MSRLVAICFGIGLLRPAPGTWGSAVAVLLGLLIFRYGSFPALAVAENLREHKVDRERENVYIKNLYEDLKSDTVVYEKYLKSGSEVLDYLDSLMWLMKSPDKNAHLSQIYFYARFITIISDFLTPNQRTYSQLKSAGLLRLITNEHVAAALSSYYLLTDEVLSQNNFMHGQTLEYWKEAGNVFDAEILYRIRKEKKPPQVPNLKLITNDPAVINRFLASAQYLYGGRTTQNESATQWLEKAKALLELIQKEYHLENK